MKRIKVFTHNDLDGVGCYILFHLIPMTLIDCTECGNYNVEERVLNFLENYSHRFYDEIYITDLPISQELAQRIDEFNQGSSGAKVTLIDHHKTSLSLEQYDWVTVDTTKSATLLVYEHIIQKYDFPIKNDKIKSFVDIVNSYDMWHWVDPNHINHKLSPALNILFQHYGFSGFTVEILDVINKKWARSLFTKSNHRLSQQLLTDLENYIVKKLQTLDIRTTKSNRTVGIVYSAEHRSEIGSRILSDNPNVEIAIIVNSKQNTVSLRTNREDIDVNEIAKQFNGGGHRKASGFKLNDLTLDEVIERGL